MNSYIVARDVSNVDLRFLFLFPKSKCGVKRYQKRNNETEEPNFEVHLQVHV